MFDPWPSDRWSVVDLGEPPCWDCNTSGHTDRQAPTFFAACDLASMGPEESPFKPCLGGERKLPHQGLAHGSLGANRLDLW